MGGNQSTIFHQGEPLSNYDILQKVPQHNISYLKHKSTNKEYMIREFAINDKTQFAQTCQKIKNRKKIHSPYLTKLQRFSQQMEDNMCSSFYKIFAMWEYPTHTLADQLNQRALQKRTFHQNELFSIIASIIQGMSSLQSSGVKHECLNTSTILFDETGTSFTQKPGTVKVADPLTSIAPSNFDRINTNRKSKSVYISPEQCESLKNQRPIPNRNPYKSDVFILGVIMLECGLLEGMDTIFVQNFQDVDLQGLNEKLQTFGKIYSKDLKLTVSTMLTRDPKERMDWIGLKQYVPQKGEKQDRRASNATSSFGYKPQINSQVVSQQPAGKITLGGGSKIGGTELTFNRESIVTNPLPKFHPEIPKPQTENNFSYQSTVAQPSSQGFAQTVSSYGYQPSASSNFGSSSANYGLNSNLYGNTTKVSNYIVETKPVYERPTEEYFVASKMNSGLPATMIDRESSSFPLNSQLEYKKDYLSGGSPNYHTPAYEYHVPTSNYSSGKNPALGHQLFNHFSAYSGLSNPTSFPTSHVAVELKSFGMNNEKTQMGSNASNNSPLLSQHVKDAKSVTYDKNLYSSYITEEKNSYTVNQEGNYYGNQYQQMGSGENGGYGHSNGYYQPINKVVIGHGHQPEQIMEAKSVPHYVPTPVPVLYQPLSSVGVKEKPNIIIQNTTQSTYPSETLKSTHTNVFMNTANIVSVENSKEPFHYQQINNQPAPTPHIQLTPMQQGSSQHSSQQELEYVIEHFKQGSRYEGTKYQDMRHGQGKFFYQDGGMYEGNWKCNKMDGFGKLYYQSGKIAYEGNWNEDQFQGYGKLYNEECDTLQEPFDYGNFDMIDEYWVYYEGNFVGDEKDGEGKMVFSNGEYFVGSFHKDMLDGRGEFHRMNGEVVRGVWSQNQLVEVEE